MSRTRYEAAFGVAPLRWKKGEPGKSSSVVLVEVWRASLGAIDPTWTNPTRPGVIVRAVIEARVHVNDAWQVIGWNGTMRPAKVGEVRRHAYLPSRSWNATITLDGWDRAPLPSQEPDNGRD